MKRKAFIDERRADWKAFQSLLVQFEKSNRRAGRTGEDVSEFSRLFRAVCYDLATVRSRDWGRDLESHLNDLVARGHNSFYRSPPGRPREILRFLTAGFPRLLRENIAYFWVALALFLLPGLIAGVLVGMDENMIHHLLPRTMLAQMDEMYREGPGQSTDDDQIATGHEATMTGFYITNNVGISFRCFATGIFFGVGTIFFLVYNSIVLGSITSYMIVLGHSGNFFNFVFAHGSFELTAIVISGAAGLIIGHSLVRPGPHGRLASLKKRGFVAIQLAVGAAVMLFIAAFIEAFWSPSPFLNRHLVLKHTGGAFFWIMVVLYLSLAGRERGESGEA